MIVAGIGCRRGVGASEIVAAVEHALARYGLPRTQLGGLATLDAKKDEPAIAAAADALRLPLAVVAADAASAATLTVSAASLDAAGSPSVSEQAALAAAGPGARLAGPRVALGAVTCALAFGGCA